MAIEINTQVKQIKVNGKVFTLEKKEYDPYNECYFYHTKEADEPFCDLSEDIEEL